MTGYKVQSFALIARGNEGGGARRAPRARQRGQTELQFGRCRGTAVDSREPAALAIIRDRKP